MTKSPPAEPKSRTCRVVEQIILEHADSHEFDQIESEHAEHHELQNSPATGPQSRPGNHRCAPAGKHWPAVVLTFV
jgi:hypothetical protein